MFIFGGLLIPVILFPLIILFVVYYCEKEEYKKTAYYQITHKPFWEVSFDAGVKGEYLTYKSLRNYEQLGARFLFNVYIPKANGGMSEIDLMMICSKGIFVFESKNYSGWIFGNTTQKMWTQTLPVGRRRSHKEAFYNPILQNKSHIKHLHDFLNDVMPTFSVIVFSERCTLKKVPANSNEFSIVKRNQVTRMVSMVCNSISGELLSDAEISRIYNLLYPCTQVNEATKMQHIYIIRKRQFDSLHNIGRVYVAEEQGVTLEHTEVDEEICPQCGNKMILRTASKGANKGKQFWGCANYPRCRYIKNI